MDILDEFFAPSQSDIVDFLIDEYEKGVTELRELHNTMVNSRLVNFLTDNTIDLSFRISSLDEVEARFRSYMWDRAFNLTDIMDFMPTELRTAWKKFIETGNGRDLTPQLQLESGFITDINSPLVFDGIPSFDEEGVRYTLGIMLKMREYFLVSMVDGIFFNLSGSHVTNKPEGFTTRFIIDNVYQLDYFGINFGRYDQFTKLNYVHDLRFVIAKLLRRNPSVYYIGTGDTPDVIKSVVDMVGYGKWCWIDGNSIKIRCYKKGTVHIELHSDLTWQLNSILAHKHPNAIPAKFRSASKTIKKEKELLKNVISDRVMNVIRRGDIHDMGDKFEFRVRVDDDAIGRKVDEVMLMMGAVRNKMRGMYEYVFEYNPEEIIKELLVNSVVPDRVSHQFYPTPPVIVDKMRSYVDTLESVTTICEPSCGTGNIIAGFDDSDYKITGYEVDKLLATSSASRFANNSNVAITNINCFDVAHEHYDIVVMNPPFSKSQWKDHVEHALTLAERVLAILPIGAKVESVKGANVKESVNTFENSFDNTSIDVKMVMFSK